MDPWYEVSCPSESDVESSMNRSHIYICLHNESNTSEENKFLCQITSNAISKEKERVDPKSVATTHEFTTITYESIRQNPSWKELSQQILKEEVVSHKPYGSWRGFSTFVIGPLREKFIVRIVREIWAIHVIQTKFVPMWLSHNYCPGGHGYLRSSEHYATLKIQKQETYKNNKCIKI